MLSESKDSKYERILLLSSRILVRRTNILKYDVFWLGVFGVFFQGILRRKYDKIQLLDVFSNPNCRILAYFKTYFLNILLHMFAYYYIITHTIQYLGINMPT